MAGVKGKSGRKPNERFVRNAVQALVLKIEEATGRTKLDALVEKMLAMALDGDMAAMKELFDRLEGKAIQAVAATDAEGADLTPGQMTDQALARIAFGGGEGTAETEARPSRLN